jgi:hypothetical protein
MFFCQHAHIENIKTVANLTNNKDVFNSTPTIPQMFSKRKKAGFPFGCADAAALDGRRGNNIYEVNPWLWQFGLGKPRLGGLSIEQTGERKQVASDAQHKQAAETKRARKMA